MGLTVIIEDENRKSIKIMPDEFVLLDDVIIYQKPFRLLKYIDLYGDTTFNAFMFDDLIIDLKQLKKYSPNNMKQISEVIS
jgi:hypothetical protein